MCKVLNPSVCPLLPEPQHACIVLTQAMAESVVRFLFEKKIGTPSDKFERNLNKLLKHNVLSKEQKEKFDKLWEKRNLYHHLKVTISRDKRILEEYAREMLKLLNEVLKEIFSFSVSDGKVKFEEPKYWEYKENLKRTYDYESNELP
jgi:uncharacterized protein YutE (UPF0331/DUF86 family)